MGISDKVRHQDEQLAAQGKPQTQQPKQPTAQAQPVLDLQVLRQVIQEVVHAELQTFQAEQPTQQGDPQPFDVQAVQTTLRAVVRTELQDIQTALTILTNAIQAQTDALNGDTDDVEQEQDNLLPTASLYRTSDDEDTEDEKVYPPDEEEDVTLDEDEDTDGEGEEDDPTNALLPRPEPPTHKLRRTGPESIILGGIHPVAGIRRWEPTYEQ